MILIASFSHSPLLCNPNCPKVTLDLFFLSDHLLISSSVYNSSGKDKCANSINISSVI
nr:MAG TPA: hypothetical protein [Bacteriophage sp.]